MFIVICVVLDLYTFRVGKYLRTAEYFCSYVSYQPEILHTASENATHPFTRVIRIFDCQGPATGGGGGGLVIEFV